MVWVYEVRNHQKANPRVRKYGSVEVCLASGKILTFHQHRHLEAPMTYWSAQAHDTDSSPKSRAVSSTTSPNGYPDCRENLVAEKLLVSDLTQLMRGAWDSIPEGRNRPRRRKPWANPKDARESAPQRQITPHLRLHEIQRRHDPPEDHRFGRVRTQMQVSCAT